MTNDLGIRLYAACWDCPVEQAIDSNETYETSRGMINRLVTAAQAIIAEREAAARKEARRECYNAVCGEFEPPVMSFAEDPEEKGYHTGVTACRDAIAKLIEKENDNATTTI